MKRVRLHHVVELEREGIQPDEISGGTWYVGLENIDSKGHFVNVERVEAGMLASTKFRFGPEHLLYGKLRPYLKKIARPTFEGICSTDIIPIRVGRHVDRNFLFYYLRQPKIVQLATTRAVGINLPRLSPKILEQFEVLLPPIKQQKRIAAILDKADALREKRQEAIAKLGMLTRSCFIDMFGDPGTNPRDWPRMMLGDLITSGPQNGLYKPATDYGSGTPILRIDAFYGGVVTGITSLKRVRISDAEAAKYRLFPGDLVINRVNSREYLGKSALIPSLTEPTVFESNMMRFRLDETRIDATYAIHFLQTRFIRDQIDRAAKDAVNQSSINQQDVKAFRVNVPPIALQQLFTRRVAKVDKLKEARCASLAKMDELFISLQHRAFRGEL